MKSIICAGTHKFTALLAGFIITTEFGCSSNPVSTHEPENTVPYTIAAQEDRHPILGLVVRPEESREPYDRGDYKYPTSIEQRIINKQGGHFSPYTMRCSTDLEEPVVEHIVSFREAHDSGLDTLSDLVKETFATDLDNLTTASSSVNIQKGSKDPAEWLPDHNQCWYVNTWVEVKKKYWLSMDQAEVDAVLPIYQSCNSFSMVRPACAQLQDAHVASFEGTKINLYNTSGGKRLSRTHPAVIEADWKASISSPSGNKMDARDWPKEISPYVTVDIKCEGEGGHFDDYGEWYPDGKDKFEVSFRAGDIQSPPYMETNGITLRAFQVGEGEGIAPYVKCSESRAVIQPYAPFSRGPVIFENNTIEIEDFYLFKPKRITITIHPIVPDSSMIGNETWRLNEVLAERNGFSSDLHMLPVWLERGSGDVSVGEAIVMLPLPETPPYDPKKVRPNCDSPENGTMARAINLLIDKYPVAVSGATATNLHVGLLSNSIDKRYYCNDISALGRGVIGGPWSVFRRTQGSGRNLTMLHEIGHTLGLPHTEDDPFYPGSPNRINEDAFQVIEIPRRVLRIHRGETNPLMRASSWDSEWLSEHNWNRIVDMYSFNNYLDTMAARRIVHAHGHAAGAFSTGEQWVCEGH